MKKRLLSLLLAFCLVFGLAGAVAPVAMAEETPTEGTYGENITWQFDPESGELLISGSGRIAHSTAEEELPWHVWKDEITAVVIEEGITHIGRYTFAGLSRVQRLEIPEGVEEIYESAFRGSAIRSVYIPKSVQSISWFVFADCPNLEFIQVDPESTNYCNDEFGVLMSYDRKHLKQIPTLFAGAYTLDDAVRYVETGSAMGCKGLTEIHFNPNVLSIDGAAFFGCDGLTSVTIPKSVTMMNLYAFSNCKNLKAIWVEEGNEFCLSDENGVVYNWLNDQLHCVPGAIGTTFVVPENVRAIREAAFYGCQDLAYLTLPEGLIQLNSRAFRGCPNLSKLVIPENVRFMEEELFLLSGQPNREMILEFQGDLPEFVYGSPFDGAQVTAYYPADNATWENREEYENVTWIPYTPHGEHTYGQWEVIREATETEYGLQKRVCTQCGVADTGLIEFGGATVFPNPFTDIAESDYFYTPVLWAASEGITTGTAATTFTPRGTCTRAQVVTFLWRAMGEPEPRSQENPFTDVDADRYYYKAVLWAAE